MNSSAFTKIKHLLLMSVFPLGILSLILIILYPARFQNNYIYEIYFLLLLGFLVLRKFKISAIPFSIVGLLLLILSVVIHTIKYDLAAVILSSLSLINFLVAVLVIIINSIFKKKSPNSNTVLFIANAIVGENPGVSGGESRFIEIGKVWKSYGYNIHLMSGKGGETLCRKMSLDVKLHSLTGSNRDDRFEFLLRTLKLLFYWPILIFEFDEGIVYSTSEQIYDVFPGFILKIFYPDRIRLAVAVHWLPPFKFWLRSGSRYINSLLFMISERLGLILAFVSADAILPVSDSTYKDMLVSGFANNRTKTVKCGVNLNEISAITSTVSSKKYEAVFMKRIQEVKGIFDLIDIWEIVVKKLPQAQLIVIGSGVDEERAKKYVQEKSLGNNVTFLGVIYDPTTKFRYISESKLFILPSLEENWAIVIGEAIASGVPVLCYDLKELVEVWKDSVTFIKFRDKEAFASRVVDLLSNQEMYEKMKNYGLEYIRQYDWNAIAQDEIALIRS